MKKISHWGTVPAHSKDKETKSLRTLINDERVDSRRLVKKLHDDYLDGKRLFTRKKITDLSLYTK